MNIGKAIGLALLAGSATWLAARPARSSEAYVMVQKDGGRLVPIPSKRGTFHLYDQKSACLVDLPKAPGTDCVEAGRLGIRKAPRP